MVNMTIWIPKPLFEKVKSHKEIKWSEIARLAISNYAEMLDEIEKIANKSNLSQNDVLELSKKVKASSWQKHKEFL